MTKQIFVLFIATLISFSALAQNSRSVEQVASTLENLDVFINYRKFRNEFQTMTSDAGRNLKFYDDYVRLNVAYNEIESQYNMLLHDIKADISNWKTIQRMGKNPGEFADRYLEDYNKVVEAYNTNFKPIHNDVMSRDKGMGGGKSLPLALVPVGIELFVQVVELIKSRREEKETAFNSILGTINSYFVDKLEMKSWSELNIVQPSQVNPSQPTTGTKINKMNSQTGTAPAAPTTTESVDVPPAVVDRLNGWLEFNYLNAEQKPERMGFERAGKSGGKDLTVAVLRPQGGQVVSENVPVNVGFFNSTQTYSEGTQFQIKAFNTGGMYVLVLNSNNNIAFLYPFNNEVIAQCGEKLGGGKDLTVLPATPFVGKDRNNVTTLPARDCGTTPPTERYITITGAGTRENLCVVLTRSELNVAALEAELEAATGELPERLAKIFGDKMIGLGETSLNMTDNRLEFDASDSEKNVLPLVFYINRN